MDVSLQTLHQIPLTDGNATCDAKWRFRLQSNFASYFLAQEPRAESASLYVATLNALDILLFPKNDFWEWKARLLESEDPAVRQNLIRALRHSGGEAQLDRHGRFVLPVHVRESLRISAVGVDFKILSDMPVRLMTVDRYKEDKQLVELGDQLDARGASEYARHLKSDRHQGRS